MKNHERTLLLFMCLLLACSTGYAQTSATCQVTPFNLPLSIDALPLTQGNGINRWHNVVGFEGVGAIPFLRLADGRFQTLKISVPGFKQFVPAKRNAFGVTVGNMMGSAGHSHGFVNSGGKTVAITVPGAIDTFVTGINRYGSIVGNFTSTTNPSGAFELKNGKFSFIQVAKGNKVASISDTGVIVGTYLVGTGNQQHVHGFVLANGQFKDFMFPGSADTRITDINASGMMVGNFDVTSFGQIVEVNNFIFKNGKFFRAPIEITEFVDNTTGLGLINGVNGFGEVTGTAFFDPEPTLSLSLAFVAKCSF